MKDFWFVWSNDFEPIRITNEDHEITSVLHRRHWQHIDVPGPYTNDENRIETFFFPITHTPMVRKTRLDVDFYILTKLPAIQRIENYDMVDESVPDYFINAGVKDEHFPTTQYPGWPQLE